MATDEKNAAERIIEKFGGQSALAKLIGRRQSTVQHWAKTGLIPAKWQGRLVDVAVSHGFLIEPSEFFPTPGAPGEAAQFVGAVPGVEIDSEEVSISDLLPTARWGGQIMIGNSELPAYVLDNGTRIMSQRAAVKCLAEVATGKTGDYLDISAIKPFRNKDLIEGETVHFLIPGVGSVVRGISAETFIDICNAYVGAFKAGQLTERQQRTAINCSIFLAGCAKVGLIALIDEATGYQYERPDDALRVKLGAFLETEMRKWEKTFPDELWMEFGRLTGWTGAIHNRPKYWGKLVNELVYEYLDSDVAAWLHENAPAPRHGQNYHQWLSSQFGLKRLVEHIYMLIGIAKTCRSMSELREKMAEHFGKTMIQVRMAYPTPKKPS